MDNIEHDDKDLEVEITDLDPIDTDSKFAAIRMTAYTLLTKRPWQQVRSSTQRVLLLCLLLLAPLIFSIVHNASLKSSIAHECVQLRPKIVYVAKEIVVSSGTQVLPADAPTTLYIQKYLPTSSLKFKALKIASMTCT